MVAYYGPGDTVTSFYLIVGERPGLSMGIGRPVKS